MLLISWWATHTKGFRLVAAYRSKVERDRRSVERDRESKDELLLIRGRLWTLFERLAIPDHALASVIREFKILGEFESIGWARIFAEAAKHATAKIVGKVHKLFAACLFIALAGYNDQILGADQRAQIAGNAQTFVGVGVDVQPGRASVAFVYLWPFQGILLGVDFLRILIPEGHAESLDEVHQEYFPQDGSDSHCTHRITLTRSHLF